LGFDRRFAKTLLVQSLPLGLAAMTGFLYDGLDILLLSAFTSDSEVGQYGLAYRAVDMAVPLSFYLVGSVYPLLAAQIAEGDLAGFRALYQRSHDVLLVAGLAALIGAVLLAPAAVNIVGGAGYGGAVVCVRILAIAIVPLWLVALSEHGLVAAGRENAVLVIAGVFLAVHIGLSLMFIPLLGKEGAALGTMITEVATAAASLLLLRRTIGWGPSFVTGVRVLPAVAVAVACAFLLPMPAPVALAIAVAAAVAGVMMSGVASVSEIRALFRPVTAGARMGTLS
jgi:O-antigen/teichoic acid export membrane protein